MICICKAPPLSWSGLFFVAYVIVMKVGTTIAMTEESLHKLILTAGEVAYDRCQNGQSWDTTRSELIDALVAVTRPLTDDEALELGFGTWVQNLPNCLKL